MKSYEFTVYERLTLAMFVLPAEGGSFREALKVRRMRNALMLSKEELEAIEFRIDDGGHPVWNAVKAEEIGTKTYELDDEDVTIIGLAFLQMEEDAKEGKRKIPTADEFLDLYVKFEDVEVLSRDVSERKRSNTDGEAK